MEHGQNLINNENLNVNRSGRIVKVHDKQNLMFIYFIVIIIYFNLETIS